MRPAAAALLTPTPAHHAAARYATTATAAAAAAAHRSVHGAASYASSARRTPLPSFRALRSYAAPPPPLLPLQTRGARFFSAAAAPNGHGSAVGATVATVATKDVPAVAAGEVPSAIAAPVLSPVETWGTKSARVWGKVKHEAHHYWVGTKLLWAEVRIASRLLRQIAGGHEMTRRERKQLLRTSADLVRMVPFVVILLVPFAEFALPVLLKFFPNMLPSTYLDSTGAEAKLQKQLLVKMEMARFLQETTHLLAQQLAAQHAGQSDTVEAKQSAQQFRDFMAKVRTGKKVHNGDIIGFSKLFDSELTLDNLDQKQLEAMCKLLDIKVFGSLWVLRYKLEERLRAIQKDDELIQKDGIDALDDAELQEACRARGIFTGPLWHGDLPRTGGRTACAALGGREEDWSSKSERVLTFFCFFRFALCLSGASGHARLAHHRGLTVRPSTAIAVSPGQARTPCTCAASSPTGWS